MSQIILSTPTSVVVAAQTATRTPAGQFAPPYPLPAPGTKVAIPLAGRNVANDIKPAPHTDRSWQYALFQSYGGGSYAADYSAGGAYVLAGMGGHNAPPCFGAAIFDFTSGRWSYLPNANGFDEARVRDVERKTETNGFPYLELSAVKTGEMPAPSHRCSLQVSPPKGVLGGPRGAVLATLGAAQTLDGWDSPQSHQFDLATGLWSRASRNLLREVTPRTPYTDCSAAYDPTARCVYVTLRFSTDDRLVCLDLNDGLWKSAGRYAPPRTSGLARSIWVDDRRRLLLHLLNNGELWAIDLKRVRSGPSRLATDGTVPRTTRRWHEYPSADGGDGSFYTFTGLGPVYRGITAPLANEQALLKLTPPDGDPLKGIWTFTTVPISSGITAQYVVDPSSGAHHETRFFYVPALRCFAWIPNGTGAVELIKP
jgi:hypothetical protein